MRAYLDTDTVCQACLGIVEYDSTEIIDTLPYCRDCIDNWCRICMPDDPRGSPETCEHRPREEDEEPQEPQERPTFKFIFITPRRRFHDLTYVERLRVVSSFDRMIMKTMLNPRLSAWPKDKQQRWARQYNNTIAYICGGSLVTKRVLKND